MVLFQDLSRVFSNAFQVKGIFDASKVVFRKLLGPFFPQEFSGEGNKNGGFLMSWLFGKFPEERLKPLEAVQPVFFGFSAEGLLTGG